MRIQSQRETFALRLGMRKRAFDWKLNPGSQTDPRTDPNHEHPSYHSPLENGHTLKVWQPLWVNPEATHWMGAIDTGNYDEDRPFDHWHPSGPYGSREEAQRATEKKYEEMFPVGTDTGPRDSGVDYSDLNRFMDEL